MDSVPYSDFEKIEIRTGTIVSAEPFPEARKPAYKLVIDFGTLGMRKSSAQITDHYQPDQLVGLQVVAVVNFPPRQVANFMSECLVLGAVDDAGRVVLLHPGIPVQNGLRIL